PRHSSCLTHAIPTYRAHLLHHLTTTYLLYPLPDPFLLLFFFLLLRPPPTSTLFPYTTLFRSHCTRRSSNMVSRSMNGLMVIRLRSEEHTSELQSLRHLVCRLLLEKKKKKKK